MSLTIFYIGYFIVEIPSNILLKMIGAKYYLPGLVIAFGLVSMCTACRSPKHPLNVVQAVMRPHSDC